MGWLQNGQTRPALTSSGTLGVPKASSIALAMASGQDSTVTSLLFLRATDVDRQRIPLSCSIRTSGATPERKAVEIALQVASLCDGHPPALPKFANTSQSPLLSRLTVTKSVPQPILNLEVWPVVVRVRDLGVVPVMISGGSDLLAAESIWPCLEPSR